MALKTSVARQDPRYRGPEVSKVPTVHTLLKLAQLNWTDHVTRMSDEQRLDIKSQGIRLSTVRVDMLYLQPTV